MWRGPISSAPSESPTGDGPIVSGAEKAVGKGMATTLEKPRCSDPLRLPEKAGTANVKVGIPSESIGIGPVVFDALVKFFGSVKALAIELEDADPSQVRNEIKSGDFRRLDRCLKAAARAVVADAMQVAYGLNRSIDDDAEQAIAQMFPLLQRLAQYVAFKRTA